MTLDKSINILNTHILCIKRQDTPFCNKDCKNCNVYTPHEELIKVNKLAIKILNQIKEIKDEVK